MTVIKHILRPAIVLALLSPAIPASAALDGKLDVPAVAAQTGDKLFAKKGADDKPGHNRRGRGRDDGPNHAFLLKLEEMLVARRGADDKPGHIRQSRGTDDTPGHVRHGRGSDDKPGDDRRGRGSDDKSGHERHGRGSDDGASDDHGGRRS